MLCSEKEEGKVTLNNAVVICFTKLVRPSESGVILHMDFFLQKKMGQ